MHLKRLLGIFGLAAAIALGAGFSLIRNNKQNAPIETEAAATNGKYRINVFVDSDNWAKDDIKQDLMLVPLFHKWGQMLILINTVL